MAQILAEARVDAARKCSCRPWVCSPSRNGGTGQRRTLPHTCNTHSTVRQASTMRLSRHAAFKSARANAEREREARNVRSASERSQPSRLSAARPAWGGTAVAEDGDRVDDSVKTIGVSAFETVTRPGNLVAVGSKHREQPSARTGPPGEDSSVLGSPLRWAPWLVLAIAAAAGAVPATSTLLIVACVVVLAGAATAFGWRVGEHRREALEQEIESRSSELTQAFTELEIAQAETVRQAVDGGRVQRRGHRRAHRADRALLDAAGRAGWHGDGLLPDGSATPRRCTTSARSRSPTRSCSSRTR